MNDQNAAAGSAHAALRITTTWQEGCRVVVAAAGQVDPTNTHRLHAALSLALQPDQALIADPSQVTFLDPHALRTLQLNQRNADLLDAPLLIMPSPAIAAILAPSTADGALSVCPALSQALAAARSTTRAAARPPERGSGR
jgi:anti-anti-sigma regulatory factor